MVLNWNEIDKIQTKQSFVVIDARGNAVSGVLSEKDKGHFVDVKGTKTTVIPHDEVVSIQQTGETFARRLHGDIDLGLSFAQSNAQKNLTLQGDVTYQATKHIAGVSASSQFTSQQETSNTNETTLKSEYFHQLRRS